MKSQAVALIPCPWCISHFTFTLMTDSLVGYNKCLYVPLSNMNSRCLNDIYFISTQAKVKSRPKSFMTCWLVASWGGYAWSLRLQTSRTTSTALIIFPMPLAPPFQSNWKLRSRRFSSFASHATMKSGQKIPLLPTSASRTSMASKWYCAFSTRCWSWLEETCCSDLRKWITEAK